MIQRYVSFHLSPRAAKKTSFFAFDATHLIPTQIFLNMIATGRSSSLPLPHRQALRNSRESSTSPHNICIPLQSPTGRTLPLAATKRLGNPTHYHHNHHLALFRRHLRTLSKQTLQDRNANPQNSRVPNTCRSSPTSLHKLPPNPRRLFIILSIGSSTRSRRRQTRIPAFEFRTPESAIGVPDAPTSRTGRERHIPRGAGTRPQASGSGMVGGL